MTMTPTRELPFGQPLSTIKPLAHAQPPIYSRSALKRIPVTPRRCSAGDIADGRRSDAAEALLTRCVALAPGHPYALHNLGKLKQQHGDHWAAIQLFREFAGT